MALFTGGGGGSAGGTTTAVTRLKVVGQAQDLKNVQNNVEVLIN